MASQPQPKLVEDFNQARPVWRSEAYVLTGYGNAPDSRYFERALKSGNGGGGSSPVIADGTVYMYSYRPSPQSEPVLKGNPFWERTYKDDDDFKAQMAKAKANERETGWVRNLPDGRVELVAEGPSGDLDQLLAEVSHGPPAARVDKVETKEEPPTGEFKGFGVRN